LAAYNVILFKTLFDFQATAKASSPLAGGGSGFNVFEVPFREVSRNGLAPRQQAPDVRIIRTAIGIAMLTMWNANVA